MSTRLFDTPPKLSERQQQLYEYIAGPITAELAGRFLHMGCRYCTDDTACQYATSNGREVLEALKRKGLLKRDRHHIYRRADQPSSQLADSDPFPEGF